MVIYQNVITKSVIEQNVGQAVALHPFFLLEVAVGVQENNVLMCYLNITTRVGYPYHIFNN